MSHVEAVTAVDERPVPSKAPSFKLRLYRAEWVASTVHPVEPLDGTVKTAQAYVDRITRSAWWRKNCPPSWMGDEIRERMLLDRSAPPRRIILHETRGGGAYAGYYVEKYRGKYHPVIRLGNKARGVGLADHASHYPPIQDPWVILHEIAHIMCCSADNGERGHGREFARFFLMLVRRWLGPDAARALREAYAAEKVKYRAR
jgi:hypothetical protein